MGLRQAATVVVVDDDVKCHELIPTILRAVADTLSVVGYAESGEQALRLVRHHLPDIVITDVHMPHVSGIELTAWIKRTFPGMRVVLISSGTREAYRLSLSSSDADAFVNKRAIVDDLVPTLRRSGALQ